jgi:predicted transposase YdaD
MGLLPLVILTEGGKQPEVVNEMVDRLAAAGEWDLLAMSNILGGLTFRKGPEREWFRKRFSMFQDILRESWVYQEIGQEFREEGLEKGREEGRLQEQREMLRDFLHLRFPETLALANQQTSNIKDPEALRTILTKLFTAQTIEEAKQILLDVNKQ